MVSGDELRQHLPRMACYYSLMTALHREILNIQRAKMTMPPLAGMCSYELSALELVWPTMADLTDIGNLMKQNRYVAALNRLVEAQQSLGRLYAILNERDEVVRMVE